MNKKERGITLIALIITVIVLLILAGTAVSIAINGGDIFGKATEAKAGWNAKVAEEENEVNGLMDYLEGAATGVMIVRGDENDWEVVGNEVVAYNGSATNLVIPNQVGNTKITGIGNNFCKHGDNTNPIDDSILGVTSLKISEGITSIGTAAFNGCSNIQGTLTIPSTVTVIGSAAFMNCGFTGKLIIPRSVTTIYGGAFSGIHFNALEVYSTNINMGAYNQCSSIIGSLTIGNTVETIGPGAFSGGSYTGDLYIPRSVRTIGSGAFNACYNLTGKLTIPNDVTSIEPGSFGGVPFNEIEIDTTEIPSYIFQRDENSDNMTGSIIIGENVRTIGQGAFMYCNPATSITIPDTVTSIGENAFLGASHIYYNGPDLENDDGSHWGAVAIN